MLGVTHGQLAPHSARGQDTRPWRHIILGPVAQFGESAKISAWAWRPTDFSASGPV